MTHKLLVDKVMSGEVFRSVCACGQIYELLSTDVGVLKSCPDCRDVEAWDIRNYISEGGVDAHAEDMCSEVFTQVCDKCGGLYYIGGDEVGDTLVCRACFNPHWRRHNKTCFVCKRRYRIAERTSHVNRFICYDPECKKKNSQMRKASRLKNKKTRKLRDWKDKDSV